MKVLTRFQDFRSIDLYRRYEWPKALILLLLYVAFYELGVYFVPTYTDLYPASAVALCVIYFGGIGFAPIIFILALVLGFFANLPTQLLIALPTGVVIQGVVGAYFLRKIAVDPLFRRYRDTFYLIVTVLAISLVTPTLVGIALSIRGIPYAWNLWEHGYFGEITVFLIVTPFILRWFSKPWFARTTIEIMEILLVFLVLIGIDFTMFEAGYDRVVGIPLVYLLYIPLFWIALRLRPRFVTLALLITAVLAVASVLMTTSIGALGERLFNVELFLITISTAFFIIVSQEEDRRRTINVMRSQLATLQNAMARVSTESKAKNDFIAILAHELRNPLAPVVSAIDLLKLNTDRRVDEMQTLAMMGDRMTTVRRLLDDLLDISRISEGKITLKQESVNIIFVIEQAILATEHHRKELHQSLVYKMPTTSITVLGDSVRLEQVFSNLLTNASKYSQSGDTISIVVRINTDSVEIEIADKGVGIGPEMLTNIFLPFHQIEQGERTKKGLGIGLALVKSFVEMHGGEVRAESAGRGKGSRFIVRLPLAKGNN